MSSGASSTSSGSPWLTSSPRGDTLESRRTFPHPFRSVARANNAVVTLGANGEITVKCVMSTGATGTTHFILDVSGYFQ